MELLEKLGKSHKTWLSMAKSTGSPYPEDLVQEMYLKLFRWYERNPKSTIIYNDEGDINTLFVFKTIRSVYNDSLKNEHEAEEDVYEIHLEAEEEDDTYEEINERLACLHWYDRKVFEYIYIKKMSIVQLSEMTGIKRYSISRTIKKVKKILNENRKHS